MTLSSSEILLLELLRNVLSLQAIPQRTPSGAEVSEGLELAQGQKLLPVAVDVLFGRSGAAVLPGAAELPEFAAYRRAARVQVLSQVQRAQAFLEVYGQLRARLGTGHEESVDDGSLKAKLGAGSRGESTGVGQPEVRITSASDGKDANAAQAHIPLVVKGCLCRAVWPKGDLRISADEDVYVRDEDFPRACAVLRGLGLVCDETADPETDFEIGWRKPDSTLYIELHRQLFAPGSSAAELQRFFDDAFRRAREYEVEPGGAKVWSMSPEDHLLYLILHAYKHFINSGFGVRQVGDVGLWARRYGSEIDHGQLMEKLDQVHALRFAAAMLAIAREDLGIDPQLPACWDEIQVDRAPMLRDLLDAGIYGGSTMSRRHSAPLTSEAEAASRANRKKSGLLRRAFPERTALLRDYPELKEHPGRLPLIWVRRLAKYRRETRSDADNSPGESLRIAREREALLALYGILPEQTGKG